MLCMPLLDLFQAIVVQRPVDAVPKQRAAQEGHLGPNLESTARGLFRVGTKESTKGGKSVLLPT